MKPPRDHPPEPPDGDRQWLVHCSPERTLVARRHEGATTLVKIFERGSLIEAQEEAELAAHLSQPGVVTYIDAMLDPLTNKPCVRMEFFEGVNLERQIAESGPMTSQEGARLMRTLTKVLADFHVTSRPIAPHGIAHRDVKPANVFLVREPDTTMRPVLIDLEHAIALQQPAPRPAASGFTGGTHGYSAPESYDGAYPTTAFDMFGLGATFFYLLTGSSAYPPLTPAATAGKVRRGCASLSLLRGQPAALRDLIASCLAVDPLDRPTSAQALTTLEQFLDSLEPADGTLDQALRAVHAGDLGGATDLLQSISNDQAHERHRELAELISDRDRLLNRVGGAPSYSGGLHESDGLEGAARQVVADLPRIGAFLRRYPLHPQSLEQRQSTLAAGHRLLEDVLPRVANQKSAAQFEEAQRLLQLTTDAARELSRTPGGLSLPTTDPGHLPGPLLRNPGQILERSVHDLEQAEAAHAALTARLEEAEAGLDLAQASVVVDEITAVYSGASQVAAQMRDRLHRLDFYVQRIAIPTNLIEQLADLLDLDCHQHELGKVDDFLKLCGEKTFQSTAANRTKSGIRGLLDTIEQLVEEFPHTMQASGPAAAALRDAMSTITDRAWEYVEDATRKLEATPVPIRPVQNLINRIDAIRMLEAFLDQAERSREQLQDRIERVRLRLDQARTARDNIARGAQEAMERGHLTTALYDMERAVKNFEGEIADDPDDPKLVERLEEAKRRKVELETDIVENHRLTALYAELVQDGASDSSDRIGVLEQRTTVLNRLVSTLGAERGSHYQTDLRDVVTQLIQEKADQGERELDAATTATERVEIASRTLADLSATIPTSTGDQGVHGQAQRILAHWQHKRRETCESQDSDRLAKEASLSRARRKARLRIAIPALVISILAGAYGFEAIYGNSPSAPPKLSTFTPQQVSLTRDDNGKLTFAADVACKELAQFAATRLDPAVFKQHTELYGLRFPALANRLNNHLMSWHPEQTADDRQSWADRLGQELSVFDGALKTLHQRARGRQGWLEVHRQISDYGRFAHTTGLHQLAISVDGLKQFESMLSAMDRYEFIAADQQLTEIQRQLQQNDQR